MVPYSRPVGGHTGAHAGLPIWLGRRRPVGGGPGPASAGRLRAGRAPRRRPARVACASNTRTSLTVRVKLYMWPVVVAGRRSKKKGGTGRRVETLARLRVGGVWGGLSPICPSVRGGEERRSAPHPSVQVGDLDVVWVSWLTSLFFAGRLASQRSELGSCLGGGCFALESLLLQSVTALGGASLNRWEEVGPVWRDREKLATHDA